MAIRVHEHLRVAVNGDQSLDVPVGGDEVHYGCHLWLRLRGGPTVSLRAGVVIRTISWKKNKTVQRV